jgi:hypothetical protein
MPVYACVRKNKLNKLFVIFEKCSIVFNNLIQSLRLIHILTKSNRRGKPNVNEEIISRLIQEVEKNHELIDNMIKLLNKLQAKVFCIEERLQSIEKDMADADFLR